MPMPRLKASCGLLDVRLLPINIDLALVGQMGARQDLHQRGLSGAVVTDDAHDLTAAQLQVHALQEPGHRRSSCRCPSFQRHSRSHKTSSSHGHGSNQHVVEQDGLGKPVERFIPSPSSIRPNWPVKSVLNRTCHFRVGPEAAPMAAVRRSGGSAL